RATPLHCCQSRGACHGRAGDNIRCVSTAVGRSQPPAAANLRDGAARRRAAATLLDNGIARLPTTIKINLSPRSRALSLSLSRALSLSLALSLHTPNPVKN